MAAKIRTVAGVVLFLLEENVDGLTFDDLLIKSNFIGHQDAFEMNIRSLSRAGKIFAWKGRFHHVKYRDEKVRAKKIAADLAAKDIQRTLRKIKKEVSKGLPEKLSTLDRFIELTGGDVAVSLKSIKSNLELISDASI